MSSSEGRRGRRAKAKKIAEAERLPAAPKAQKDANPPATLDMPTKPESSGAQPYLVGPSGFRAKMRVLWKIFLWAWFDKSAIFAWIFRIFTVLSVSYLLYDRYYETHVIISVSASDPKNPFEYPFSVTNSSHIFTMEHIDYTCGIKELENSVGGGMSGIGIKVSREYITLFPGKTVNVSCKRALGFGHGISLKKLTVEIILEYDVSIFDIYKAHREEINQFTWDFDASNPQWIRGELVP